MADDDVPSSRDWMLPPKWDKCAECGRPLEGMHWASPDGARHTECVDWKSLPQPPYLHRVKELRERYTRLRDELRAVEAAGRALTNARQEWPNGADAHAARIVEAIGRLDRQWPVRPKG